MESLGRRTPAFCNCSFTTGSFASRYYALMFRALLVMSHDDPCKTQYIARAVSEIAKDSLAQSRRRKRFIPLSSQE